MDAHSQSDNQATNETQSTSNLETSLPPRPPALGKRKPLRTASDVWNHFTKVENSDPNDPRCICNYCGKDYACDTKRCGTTTLRNHLTNQCKKYPGRVDDKRQKILVFGNQNESGGSNLLAIGNFNKEACRLACAKMIVLDELPFSFVEGHGFRHFCSVACPKFDPPSRRTIVRDIYQLYLDEKLELKNYFSVHCQRVSLTTDAWTSIQNISYMSLTAHYIDSDWMLQKRILNFCVLSNHKGDTIGKVIECCLLEWGIQSVFTITVDNASANNVAISYLSKKLNNWNNKGCILDGKYLHMRCCAHIINLIVCEGLKEAHESIVSIRNAVKYVKSSLSRLQKFKECASHDAWL